jgi:hypothetical protein
MNNNRPILVAAAVIVMIAVAALFQSQYRTSKRLEAENAALQQEMARLRVENQSLSDTAKSSASLSEVDLRDLMRLRAQATQMSQTEQENAHLKAERDTKANQVPTEPASPVEPALPEPTNEQARRMAGVNFAKFLALGCFMYADRHNGQMPADLAALDSDLRYQSDERSPSYVSSEWASAVEVVYGI